MASHVNDCKGDALQTGLSHKDFIDSYACPEKEPSAMASKTDPTKEEEILSRPILVGYAFGPKKMSTMGVVMAEASKTNLSSVATTVLVEEAVEDETADDEDDDQEVYHNAEECYAFCCHGDDDDENDHITSNHNYHCRLDYQEPPKEVAFSEEVKEASTTSQQVAKVSPARRIVPSDTNGNIVFSLDSYSGGLKNIVRYLHSSCSSVDTNSTSTTLLTAGTTVTPVTPSSASTCGKLGASVSGTLARDQHQQRLRVSFVPLDPDLPLEGQHGAKMDIILHKLTEDILCLSKFSHQFPRLVHNLGHLEGEMEHTLEELESELPKEARAAILRVHRLMQYHKKHPECALADDPAKVLTLMSRSDIAHALKGCLVGVASESGLPVASPKFVVWEAPAGLFAEEQTLCIAERLKKAQMSYPIIAKPLQAAGTKVSHLMTVLLNESSLEHIHGTPCLLQEYVNHDAVLYKVYVLGNNVRVYQRPSLPNLPERFKVAAEDGDINDSPNYVDFDSQRPYPRLSAFGVSEGRQHQGRIPPPFLSSLSAVPSAGSTSSTSTSSVTVTTEEVQPIVEKLKEAFGLELFGFDILITSSELGSQQYLDDDNSKRQMLVVDVNYFPSYKEVSNFASLLAQYLTQRAIDSRR